MTADAPGTMKKPDEARPGLGLRLGELGIALGELARTGADNIGGDPFSVSCRK